MTTKEFNELKEIQKYYDKESNTYVFKDNDEYIDLVIFNFDLKIEASIDAYNIYANSIDVYNIKANKIYACNIDACNINTRDIHARNIYAWNLNTWDIHADDIYADDINAVDINAWNIDADNISYYAVCFAHKSIKCESIKGRITNAKHFVLDGKIIFKDEEIEDE